MNKSGDKTLEEQITLLGNVLMEEFEKEGFGKPSCANESACTMAIRLLRNFKRRIAKLEAEIVEHKINNESTMTRHDRLLAWIKENNPEMDIAELLTIMGAEVYCFGKEKHSNFYKAERLVNSQLP